MQAMVLLNSVGLSRLNAPLGTVFQALATADTFIKNNISFVCEIPRTNRVALPEDWIDTKIEILDFCVLDFKDNPRKFSGVAGIDVREIGLLCKDCVNLFLLFVIRDENRLC